MSLPCLCRQLSTSSSDTPVCLQECRDHFTAALPVSSLRALTTFSNPLDLGGSLNLPYLFCAMSQWSLPGHFAPCPHPSSPQEQKGEPLIYSCRLGSFAFRSQDLPLLGPLSMLCHPSLRLSAGNVLLRLGGQGQGDRLGMQGTAFQNF